MVQAEVPSPIDFHLMQDARDWESTAMDRPYRLDMFRKITDCLLTMNVNRALELGSGPGFLAKFLCERISGISLTLLDFSEAMHTLARERLTGFDQSIEFIQRDLKSPVWPEGLDRYDCIYSNQTVHELRHKSRAKSLHLQVRKLLTANGVYLVCDHFHGRGAMKNDQLFMTPKEQVAYLEDAGFRAEVLLRKGSLQLIKAT